MNHFTYDIETKSWSFTYLSNDQIMDLSALDHQLYMKQRWHWECGEGSVYELLMALPFRRGNNGSSRHAKG